ncbi:hypothetical protein B0I08_103323 [Glaciihabitans tibetensis]|uniref:Uncharacterized protein n=1 Tax=Glaciihabitans tibetensis TaxID=1266600 RepID=A0A2T0VFX3_9MICO|nr:hypothetical protein [Glaciihabitans tibetensis]PRY69117.1 hypothetical protein B0I08_103323 [Glaciihabitans tibetensis]
MSFGAGYSAALCLAVFAVVMAGTSAHALDPDDNGDAPQPAASALTLDPEDRSSVAAVMAESRSRGLDVKWLRLAGPGGVGEINVPRGSTPTEVERTVDSLFAKAGTTTPFVVGVRVSAGADHEHAAPSVSWATSVPEAAGPYFVEGRAADGCELASRHLGISHPDLLSGSARNTYYFTLAAGSILGSTYTDYSVSSRVLLKRNQFTLIPARAHPHDRTILRVWASGQAIFLRPTMGYSDRCTRNRS